MCVFDGPSLDRAALSLKRVCRPITSGTGAQPQRGTALELLYSWFLPDAPGIETNGRKAPSTLFQ